jgi:hypothetical protein
MSAFSQRFAGHLPRRRQRSDRSRHSGEPLGCLPAVIHIPPPNARSRSSRACLRGHVAPTAALSVGCGHRVHHSKKTICGLVLLRGWIVCEDPSCPNQPRPVLVACSVLWQTSSRTPRLHKNRRCLLHSWQTWVWTCGRRSWRCSSSSSASSRSMSFPTPSLSVSEQTCSAAIVGGRWSLRIALLVRVQCWALFDISVSIWQ